MVPKRNAPRVTPVLHRVLVRNAPPAVRPAIAHPVTARPVVLRRVTARPVVPVQIRSVPPVHQVTVHRRRVRAANAPLALRVVASA